MTELSFIKELIVTTKFTPVLLNQSIMAPRVRQAELKTRFLLNKGLDPNTTSAKWGTPFHRAIQSARPNIVKVLLDAGAGPTGQLADLKYAGASPLRMARDIKLPEVQEAILSLLRSRGVDVGGGDGSAEVE
ncbi:hypothetical protein APSETT444_004889 [Aspergillus pseudonomiae]